MSQTFDAKELDEIPSIVQRVVGEVRERVDGGEWVGQWQRSEIIAQQNRANDRFAARQAPDGQAWPQNAASTIKRKGHTRILEGLTMRLRNSIRSQTGDSVREISDTGSTATLSFGTSRPYAYVHQVGSDRIPQRRFLGFIERDADQIANRVADEIIRGL